MANTKPAAPQETDAVSFHLTEAKANPFVGMDKLTMSGFEPIKVTIARNLDRKAKKATNKVAKNAAREADVDKANINVDADYKPLQPGENL